MKEKISGIYTITNSCNKRVYVGCTKNFAQRKAAHISALRHNRHQCVDLQDDWNNHGGSYFKFELIEKVSNHSLLYERECFYIEQFKYPYNKTKNSQRFEYLFSALRRRRLSARLRRQQQKAVTA